jgi:hypothetical protein
MDPDADPGCPKTYGSYGSGSGCGFGNAVKFTSFFKVKKIIKKLQNSRN